MIKKHLGNLLLIFALVSCCTQKHTDNVIVYVTATGTKYHLSSCRYLSRNCEPVSLQEAYARGYGDCSDCMPPLYKPPVQQEDTLHVSDQLQVPSKGNTLLLSEPVRVQCSGITKSGIQCKRMVKSADQKCFQHKR